MSDTYKLSQIKNLFREKLQSIYALPELESIYKLCVEYILGWNRTMQIINRETEISTEKFYEFTEILIRLKTKEPLQYIIGQTEFYSLNFKVNESVLIPRQETELLVESILKSELPDSPKILDIGTGSGCIAISLKSNIPNAEVVAMDVSVKALKVAEENALLNNTEIHFIEANILNKDLSLNKFDLIVSNPPYVREEEKTEMHENVLKHEPELALFVPNNSHLIFYEAIAEFGRKHLANTGSIWVEINEAFGQDTSNVFKKNGFEKTIIINDLNGKERFVKAWV